MLAPVYIRRSGIRNFIFQGWSLCLQRRLLGIATPLEQEHGGEGMKPSQKTLRGAQAFPGRWGGGRRRKGC